MAEIRKISLSVEEYFSTREEKLYTSKYPCKNVNEILNHFAAKGTVYCVTIAVVIFEITFEDNTLFSCVNISCFRAKAYLVFIGFCILSELIFKVYLSAKL